MTSKKPEPSPYEKDGLIVAGITYPFWWDLETQKALGMVRGQFQDDEQKIFLDPRLPRDVLLRTVLHEGLHGIFCASTLTAGNETNRELSEELEEKVCTLLERELPTLFKDNPWLQGVFE